MDGQSFARAVSRRTSQVHSELAPKVRAACEQRALMSVDLAVAVNVTQNVIKEALAVAMDRAMPQPEAFFGELATRLACYCLTALPPDAQEQAALAVQRALLVKLADMQADGNVLKAEWGR